MQDTYQDVNTTDEQNNSQNGNQEMAREEEEDKREDEVMILSHILYEHSNMEKHAEDREIA